MAQLRQDYQEYIARQTEVIVVGPENKEAFAKYWQENSLPFIGLPDPKATVLRRYGQEVNLFKLGRMPAQVIVDKKGLVRYVHYGHSMSDIPENCELFDLLDRLNRETNALSTSENALVRKPLPQHTSVGGDANP
jgi:peroxiredoxin Q/BCP